MTASLLLLATLTCLPAQANAPRRSPWPPPYDRLGLLYVELNDLQRAYMAADLRIQQRYYAADRQDASLSLRLRIARERVRLVDESCRKADDIRRRFDLAYPLTPEKLHRGTFYDAYEFFGHSRRAGARKFLYGMASRRWPGGKKWAWLNSRVIDFVTTLTGCKNDEERFWRRIASVEIFFTDLAEPFFRSPASPAQGPGMKPR